MLYVKIKLNINSLTEMSIKRELNNKLEKFQVQEELICGLYSAYQIWKTKKRIMKKNILLTGCSRGVGLEIAKILSTADTMSTGLVEN